MNRQEDERMNTQTGTARYIFWDLDGTLTESGDGIINSVMYALRKKGIEENDRKKLSAFVGPPLRDSFMKHYGFSLEEAEECVKFYREYFVDRGMFENRVYDGIPEVLEELCREGYELIVTTSKPEVFSVRIMEHFQIAQYFRFIGGSSLDEKRNAKADVIRYVLDTLGLDPARDRIVMIGDRDQDVNGAAANQIPCIGVLYGYGSRGELEAAGAAAICETVRELPCCIRSFFEN